MIDFVEKNQFGEIIVNCTCETSYLGVFAAGDVTNVPEKQIIIAAGEGCKAALSAFRSLKKKGLTPGSRQTFYSSFILRLHTLYRKIKSQ